MVLSAYSFDCSPLSTIGLHHHRSLLLARWSVACRGTPIQTRCLLPSRSCATCRATTTCIAEVAPPKLGGFADVQSEEQFVAVLKAGVAAKKIPEQLLPGFLDFYNNYKSALLPLGDISKNIAGYCVHVQQHSHGKCTRASWCQCSVDCHAVELEGNVSDKVDTVRFGSTEV